MSPPQPGRHCPDLTERSRVLQVRFRRYGPTPAPLRSPLARPRAYFPRSATVRESWARRLVRRPPRVSGGHPVSRKWEIDYSLQLTSPLLLIANLRFREARARATDLGAQLPPLLRPGTHATLHRRGARKTDAGSQC